ncbi:hypothetical protein [Streptomyces sp. NPDC059909]|uniref:hypothetical protein n=1 Tax=Streptomyces sp. NPDC059909 TaxID=3346998 RepID=UPI00364FC844
MVAEVERLTTELAALGADSVRVGRPIDREGGLREFDILGGRGFISFLPVPRHECVYVCTSPGTGDSAHGTSPRLRAFA